jgi:N-acetylated-alpha-linked acidic dipeptidase
LSRGFTALLVVLIFLIISPENPLQIVANTLNSKQYTPTNCAHWGFLSSWLNTRASLTYDSLQEIFLGTPNADKAREWSSYYTAESHLPGQGYEQAVWTKQQWDQFGLPENNIASHDIIAPEPRGQCLALLDHTGQVLYEAALVEDQNKVGNIGSKRPFISAFHGFSASGNVTAEYVYVNFGTTDDFADLVTANIPLQGRIAIIKYGRIGRGEQVLNAQNMGMVGVVLYNDPQQDGAITEANGYKPFPDGPARAATSVERGSVGNIGELLFG